jgi:hypothetical protein
MEGCISVWGQSTWKILTTPAVSSLREDHLQKPQNWGKLKPVFGEEGAFET